MLLRILDLLGVAVFAISGALAGMATHLDLLGILVLASVTAVGGGTIRDLLLNRHPIFWIRDPWPLLAIVAATAFTLVWVHYLPVPRGTLLVADAFGLALFAMSGAQIAESARCHASVVILMGTLRARAEASFATCCPLRSLSSSTRTSTPRLSSRGLRSTCFFGPRRLLDPCRWRPALSRLWARD